MPIPKSDRGLEHTSASERIYEVLIDWIIDGTLQPGEKLSVEELAEHFGVSRTPVREAIQKLAFQKLVNVYRNKMTCVSELDLDDISVLYRPLAQLQYIITLKAGEHMTPEDKKQLEKTVRELEAAVKKKDVLAALKADERFHLYLLAMDGNEYIKDLFTMLCKHVQRVSYAYYINIQPLTQSPKIHQTIIDELAAGELLTAAKTSQVNWLEAMEGLSKMIEERKAAEG